MIYIFIFILTLGDVILTVWGVTNKYIEEGNPLVRNLMHSYPLLTGLAVLAVVGLLLIFLSKQKIKWLGYAAGGLIGIKIVVMLMHAAWIGGVA